MNNQKNMLIVDDIELNRKMIAASFSQEFGILEAVDGLDAQRVVTQNAESIQIILLDIIMPNMNGIAFLKWLSASAFSNIPVIAVTTDESYQLEALKNGASDFIEKQTEIEIIKARVNNVLCRFALEQECLRNLSITKEKREMDHIVNSIPGGIALYRMSDCFETVYFSDGVAQLSGHTRAEYAEWVKQDAMVAVYEEDRKRILDAVRVTLKTGQPIDETYRIYHKNGSLVWVRLNGILLGVENGMPMMHAVFQKPSRMAQLFDNLVNESQSIIYVSDINNYDLLYINDTGLKSLGKGRTDYASQKCYSFLFGKKSPCEFCKIKQMNATSFLQRDFRFPRTDRIYSLRGKLTDWNGLPAHVEYAQDVTEVRNGELQNKALVQQLQSVMEHIPGGLCVYCADKTGLHPVVHNHSFFEIFGYSREHEQEVMKITGFLNVHPDDLSLLREKINDAIQNNSKMDWTYRSFHDRKNCYIWINMKAVVVPQSNGEKICYVSYMDVTSERETQEALIQTQKVLEELRQKAQDALEKYQTLVNAVPGGIVQYEIQGTKVLTRYFSDGICELTGCSKHEREQLCSQDVLSLTYPQDVEMLSSAIQNAVAKKENISTTYRLKTKSGIPKWVHLSAAYSVGKHGENLYQAVFTDVDKLKHIEQELQENQLRYEVAIKSSGINIWEYDIQKDSLYVVSNSPRIKQNCFHIEHYIDSTLHNGYVREDSIERFLSIFERLQNGVKELSEDIWYKTTDETGWWCERITYTTTFDQNGKPLKAFGAGRDVTREKEAEKKFHEETSYRKAIQSNNMVSVILDLTSNQVLETDSTFRCIRELNGGTVDRYFEQTQQKIIGTHKVAEYSRSFHRNSLLNRFNSGVYVLSMDLTRVYDTQKIYWINYSVHLIQNPETHHIIAHISCIDITQEKVMQTIMETVTKTDYDFFVVVDGSKDSAVDYAVDNDNHRFYENDSFEAQVAKLAQGEVCPEDLQRVIAECKIDSIWQHIKDGETYKFNFSIITPNGEVRRKQLQFSAISSPFQTFLMSRIDVNSIYEEQEESKRQLKEALSDAKRANRAKTDFLSRMSHDIRTPMNAVLSLAALGMDSTSLSEAQDSFYKIGLSGKYLLSIINDVLNLSKMEHHGLQLHPVVVDLPDFMQETMSIVMPSAKEKQVHLQYHQNGVACRYLKLDSTCVRQVIINLLSNAIKFTPSGGQVDLIFENISQKGYSVCNRITVKDTGIGIGKDFLPKVFAPFEQENTQNDLIRQGTGLGLSIVKTIVELMGGKIWVESRLGHGSSFFVEWTLEIVPDQEAKSLVKPKVALDESCLLGKRVLLCEDHPLNFEIAKKLLEKKKLIVDHAPNGQQAVESFAQSEPHYYDAVLMDIRMPVMNGLEATKKIRAMQRADAKCIPIIAMTANAFDEDVQQSIAAGMNAHLAKPIDPQKLYETLAQWINRRKDVK